MEATMETLTGIAAFILFASLKSTLLVGLVLAAQKLFARHLSASGRYLLWMAVVIGLVTPVGFAISLPSLPPIHASAETGLAAQVPVTLEDSTVAYADSQAIEASPQSYVDGTGLRWDSALSLLWLSGLILVITAMTLSSRRFTTLARNGNPAPERLQQLLRQCEQQAGYASAIRLVASPDLRAPVVAGLLKPVLLWPAGLEALLTPTQLQHVLMHEVMHVKRRDIFSACVVAVLQALHWFNPAIWIAFSWLRQDREMACDAATVRTLHNCDAHDYAHTLIQLGALRPEATAFAPGLGILDSPAQLRRRIHMLAQLADPSARHFLAGLLLLAFSALAFSQPAAAPQAAEAATAPVAAQTEVPLPAPVVAMPPAVVERTLEAVIESAPVAAVDRAPAAASPAPRVIAKAREVVEASAPHPVGEPMQDAIVTPVSEEMIIASAETTRAAPASILQRTIAVAQAVAVPPATSAPAETSEIAVVCRGFFSANAGRWRACDNEANWSEFAAGMQVALEDLPEPRRLRSGEKSVGLRDTVCREQSAPGSRVRNRVCMTAAQWAATDLQRPGLSNAYRNSLYPADFNGTNTLPIVRPEADTMGRWIMGN